MENNEQPKNPCEYPKRDHEWLKYLVVYSKKKSYKYKNAGYMF